MTPKESASSQQGPQREESGQLTVRPFTPGRRLGEEERARLQRLAEQPEDMIDTEDIPELPPDRPYIFNPYVSADLRLKKAS